MKWLKRVERNTTPWEEQKWGEKKKILPCYEREYGTKNLWADLWSAKCQCGSTKGLQVISIKRRLLVFRRFSVIKCRRFLEQQKSMFYFLSEGENWLAGGI
jgi:hypothetical protein